MKNKKLPTIKEIRNLMIALKPDIGDEYRTNDQEDETPTMDVTIGWNDATGEWDYQTGDNSYSGSAYFFPHWAVVGLTRRSNSTDLARDIVSQLDMLTW